MASPANRRKPLFMASYTPLSGSEKTRIASEPNNSTTFSVAVARGAVDHEHLLLGMALPRKDSMVKPIVASELKLAVTTLIFMAHKVSAAAKPCAA